MVWDDKLSSDKPTKQWLWDQILVYTNGAPCAVPIDPRHRFVTTKYNPAHTFTPEGAVGIDYSYLEDNKCYSMVPWFLWSSYLSGFIRRFGGNKMNYWIGK